MLSKCFALLFSFTKVNTEFFSASTLLYYKNGLSLTLFYLSFTMPFASTDKYMSDYYRAYGVYPEQYYGYGYGYVDPYQKGYYEEMGYAQPAAAYQNGFGQLFLCKYSWHRACTVKTLNQGKKIALLNCHFVV